MRKCATSAGYSGTPLAKKLGIRNGHIVAAVGAPPQYGALLSPMPPGARVISKATADADITHLFVTRRADLVRSVNSIRQRLADDGVLWVSWPKKASGVDTDITEDVIRDVALPLGLVDVKVCAIDDVWSGLKLVVRRELRGKR